MWSALGHELEKVCLKATVGAPQGLDAQLRRRVQQADTANRASPPGGQARFGFDRELLKYRLLK
jgi:hypothetical protein